MEIISGIILIILGGLVILYFCLLRKSNKDISVLLYLLWVGWCFISLQLSQLPVRKERIDCGIFSFKVHKKYIPCDFWCDVFGDEYYGKAFIYDVRDGTFMLFEYVDKSNERLGEEYIKDRINDDIKSQTKEDEDGYKEWFVSREPSIHEMFASVDYKTTIKYREFKKFARDIIFIRTYNEKSYLCRLHLCRKSKWALNRSERIFFNTLRLNSKSIAASQRGAEDDVLDLIIDEHEQEKGEFSDLI